MAHRHRLIPRSAPGRNNGATTITVFHLIKLSNRLRAMARMTTATTQHQHQQVAMELTVATGTRGIPTLPTLHQTLAQPPGPLLKCIRIARNPVTTCTRRLRKPVTSRSLVRITMAVLLITEQPHTVTTTMNNRLRQLRLVIKIDHALMATTSNIQHSKIHYSVLFTTITTEVFSRVSLKIISRILLQHATTFKTQSPIIISI